MIGRTNAVVGSGGGGITETEVEELSRDLSEVWFLGSTWTHLKLRLVGYLPNQSFYVSKSVLNALNDNGGTLTFPVTNYDDYPTNLTIVSIGTDKWDLESESGTLNDTLDYAALVILDGITL